MSSQPSEFKLDAPPEFSAKIATIFAQLGDLEKKRNESLQLREQGTSSVQKEEPTVLRDDEFAIPRSKLQLDRRNSFSPCSSTAPRRRPPFEFRRPKVPPLRQRVPDHKVHPENWTKYSLASVEDSQMSDGANTAAALAYLKQQERRSQGQALWDEDAQLLDLRAKVMFHSKKKNNERLRPKFLTDSPSAASNAKPLSQNVQAGEAVASSGRPNFGTEVRTLVENRANDHRKIALSHLQEVDDEDDEAMKVDENIKTPPAETTTDEGSSIPDRDGQPKMKKLKRMVRPRSDADQSNEGPGVTGRDETF